jgi:hypothetical protein
LWIGAPAQQAVASNDEGIVVVDRAVAIGRSIVKCAGNIKREREVAMV